MAAHFRYLIPIVGVLLAQAAIADDDDTYTAPDRSVTLDAQSKAHLGIVTTAAAASQYRGEIRGFGQVLGADTLAQADADLSLAEASARASQAALARAQGLFNADTGVSRQVLEAAQHQAETDAAQLSLAQHKAAAAWGHDAPWRDAASRRALMAKIASGEAAIVRATFPAGAITGSGPGEMHIERLASNLDQKPDQTWTAKTVWSAPADPTVPGRSFFMLVENAHDLVQGDHVRVIASGGDAQQGAVVPAGAIVIAEGGTWLYIEEKPNYFVRQAVGISQPAGGGYFIPHGVAPGEQVVTSGAGHLLARETGTDD